MKITENIKNAQELAKKRKTKNKIMKNRFQVRKRRAAVRAGKEAAPNNTEEIMDHEADEDVDMEYEDEIHAEIAKTLE